MTKVEFEPGPCNYSFFISPLSSEEVGAHCGGHINSNSAGSAHGLCQLPPTLISCPRHSAQPFLLVVLFAENPRLWELRGTSEVPWSPSCSISEAPWRLAGQILSPPFLEEEMFSEGLCWVVSLPLQSCFHASLCPRRLQELGFPRGRQETRGPEEKEGVFTPLLLSAQPWFGSSE